MNATSHPPLPLPECANPECGAPLSPSDVNDHGMCRYCGEQAFTRPAIKEICVEGVPEWMGHGTCVVCACVLEPDDDPPHCLDCCPDTIHREQWDKWLAGQPVALRAAQVAEASQIVVLAAEAYRKLFCHEKIPIGADVLVHAVDAMHDVVKAMEGGTRPEEEMARWKQWGACGVCGNRRYRWVTSQTHHEPFVCGPCTEPGPAASGGVE